VFYSDGVTEARDAAGRFFGDDRLAEAARSAAAGGDASAVSAAILDAVADFTAGVERSDDLTLVVVQRRASLPIEPSSTGLETGRR
jgi:phosphoserine phosphatase RsbU/P